MGQQKLRGKDLRKLNFPSNKSISLTIDVMSKHFKHSSKSEQLDLLIQLVENPEKFYTDERLQTIAKNLKPPQIQRSSQTIYPVLNQPKDFSVFGRKEIDQNTLNQMEIAMSLPVSEGGALMPDAHQGYGLPIGGVLATKNEVIPYGVGVDIGCRMSLSLFDAKPDYLDRYHYQFKKALKDHTFFGNGTETDKFQDHQILEDDAFKSLGFLKQLHGKAAKQLGSSGSGNHFVEFGVVNLWANNDFGVKQGEYLALLAHSGSRGLGATTAQFYTSLAKKNCVLPAPAQNLAWLDLNTDNGKEYWMAMNLAGNYAKACHDVIHDRLTKALGLKALFKVENHHNFAWKEYWKGEEYIIHRKGATPAKPGEHGIIPASMTAAGYLVKGKGKAEALNSASHGAGRKFSRRKAKASFTMSSVKQQLKEHRVSLIGGGVDEAPMAYKNIEHVMKSQQNLVEVWGSFKPRIVRMDKA